MPYHLLADFTVVLHFGFVLFVVLGGLLLLRWPRVAWLHLPAVAWGALIEFAGWLCPLTPLENRFRRLAGERGYEGGFVEHYLTSILYPSGLTRELQLWLGAGVLLLNAAIYALLWRRRRARPTGLG
ncbi:MAG: DUF2784 domain-containing protein [Longimicrobiaceae bacterium]